MVSVIPQDGETALISAVRKHSTEIVKVLLAAGADVNLQEKVNKTKSIYIHNATCVPFTFWYEYKTFHVLS